MSEGRVPSALDHAKAHNQHATRPNQHDEAWAAGEIECAVAGRTTSPNDDIEPAMTGAVTGRVSSCLYGRDPGDCSACQEAQAHVEGRTASSSAPRCTGWVEVGGGTVKFLCSYPSAAAHDECMALVRGDSGQDVAVKWAKR